MDFQAFNKKQRDSFAKQQNLLKKLSKGQSVTCETCQTPIRLTLGEPGFANARCDKGCTDIVLQLQS